MKLPLRFRCGAICASWILLPHIVLAQTCYYPNGDISTSDYPCSSDSDFDGLCCPLNWQCLSNGLCYLENEQYYGRYTCTDQTWQSSGCPELCTDGNTDYGDQAVLQCQGGEWCCDHNRSSSNVCCDSTNSNDFFPLAEGTSVAFISTTGPAAASPSIVVSPVDGGTTSSDTTSSATTSKSSSSSATTPTPSSTTTTSASASTSTSTSTTRSAGGGAANQSPTNLVTVTSIVITSAANGGLMTTTNMIMQTPSPNTVSASSSSNHGAAIGGGVAGGVALIALISLAFLFLHRRKKRQQYRSAPTAEYRNSIDYMYKANDMGSPNMAETSPEIDGTPIVGVYKGWGPTGGEGALRVVNGSDRQSTVSGLTGTNARDSMMSELEGPTSPVRPGIRSPQPTIAEQPYELTAEREK